MADQVLGKRPLEVRTIIYISLAILAMDFVNFFLLGGYFNYKSASIFIMMTGLLILLMWGVWNQKNWIRLAWIVMSIMGISTALLNILTKQMPVQARIIYSIQFVLSLAILYYLTNKKTVSWFKGIKTASFAHTETNDRELTKEQLNKKKGKLKFSNQEEYEEWKAGRLKTTTESQQNEPGIQNDSSLVPGEKWKDPFLGMEFVFVSGGWFEMEDTSVDVNSIGKPAYRVYLDGFWMGRFAVTQGQWEKLMDYNPSGYKKGSDYPVEHVTWNDVAEFIFRFNRKTAMSFRLPTEEEWEYAARSGGKKEEWAGTENESELAEYAWYAINSGEGSHPVGEKRPNGLGLYDMSGNVWEWVQRDYGAVEQGKVIRGGSWRDPPVSLRTSARVYVAPNDNDRVISIGFRLVLPKKAY